MKKNIIIFRLLLATLIYTTTYVLSKEKNNSEKEFVKSNQIQDKKEKHSLLKKALILRENTLIN